jgi:signal transduction histidine kinase
MGGQLFFITSTTNKLLTILTIILLAGLSVILFKNLKRESDQRVHIEKLNIQLGELIKQRESLVHLVTHKVKGSFTRTKYIFAGLLDGTFGEISPEVRKYAKQGLESDNTGIQTVDLVLNAANLQKGAVKYQMKVMDVKEIILKTIADKKVQAEAQGLQMESFIEEQGVYNVMGDVFWLKEAFNNLIDNSIKYTKAGKITVELKDGDGKVRFTVKDTGIGITKEDKKNLFTEGGRGKDSIKTNVDSTGYGLYSVKLIIEAHNGKVSAESEGEGKGSTFIVELPAYLEAKA